MPPICKTLSLSRSLSSFIFNQSLPITYPFPSFIFSYSFTLLMNPILTYPYSSLPSTVSSYPFTHPTNPTLTYQFSSFTYPSLPTHTYKLTAYRFSSHLTYHSSPIHTHHENLYLSSLIPRLLPFLTHPLPPRTQSSPIHSHPSPTILYPFTHPTNPTLTYQFSSLTFSHSTPIHTPLNPQLTHTHCIVPTR